VLRSRIIHGVLTIPAVAYDGSAAGLSADGTTLVLIEPRKSFPRAETTLVVLDTRALRVRTLVRLRGDFSFDAVSPDGRSRARRSISGIPRPRGFTRTRTRRRPR